MSGYGYPWNFNGRVNQNNNDEEDDDGDENPLVTHWRRQRRSIGRGYLPHSQHLASSRNAVDAYSHYRRMYQGPQYPFGASYQTERPQFSISSYGNPRSRDSLDRRPNVWTRLLAVGGTGAAGGAGASPSPPTSSSSFSAAENSPRVWDESQWDRVTMTRPFLDAIEQNDVETVRSIINEHQRLSRCRIDPIHYAILKGHFGLIPILVEAGCDPNTPDMIRCTPLMNAVKGKMYAAVDKLLEAGADPNVHSGRKRELPLLEAVYSDDVEMVEKLLAQNGIDIDATSLEGYENETALMIAIYLGRLHMVDILLTHGADPNVGRGMERPTPCHIAMTAGSEHDLPPSIPHRIFELLLAFGAVPDSPDSNGFSPLHIAAMNDREDILEMILNSEAKVDVDVLTNEGDTALFVGVIHGSPRSVAKLLSAGCCLDTNDDEAGYPGSGLVSKAFHLGHFTIVKLLLTAGAHFRNKRRLVRRPRAILGSGAELLANLQQYQSLLLFLERRELAPAPLRAACIDSIRRRLKRPMAASVARLPLPELLRQALFMREEFEALLELEPMGSQNQREIDTGELT